MARFKFNLVGVLRQRKQVERDKQRVLAERLVVVTQFKAELEAMDAQMRQSAIDLRQNRLTGKIDLAFIAAHRRYSIAMQRKAVDVARRIAAAQQSADAARLELAEAAKQRKIVEKLREKRFQEWRAEISRKELLEMDEAGALLGRAGG